MACFVGLLEIVRSRDRWGVVRIVAGTITTTVFVRLLVAHLLEEIVSFEMMIIAQTEVKAFGVKCSFRLPGLRGVFCLWL
jgi:hypothetical protein